MFLNLLPLFRLLHAFISLLLILVLLSRHLSHGSQFSVVLVVGSLNKEPAYCARLRIKCCRAFLGPLNVWRLIWILKTGGRLSLNARESLDVQ
ncbi:hypothetical protein HBH98_098360 [Parastagonospora nodorum]|nr:hypothetical protein HBH49_143560 [Parastagonospora nodorum]KAH4346811.1 hypothetical protein HBH98_098360 [Parastagonospora nodorum]KAH4382134.1 hypothetical protein HBH97_081470 [Parastagonospora nodorum]KAH4398488.1 hypothetical protein HBH99_111290 [Parastagonospora nodorum]KAH4897571.1 hypothetical protein HBI80_191150 [Parastagonospora nodorum]